VQPEAAGDRVATDSDRQSGRAGTGWTAGWQAYSYARCSGFHLLATWMVVASRTQPSSGPSMRRPVGLLGIPGVCSWPADRFARPGTLTTSLSLTGACNDNDRTVSQLARTEEPDLADWYGGDAGATRVAGRPMPVGSDNRSNCAWAARPPSGDPRPLLTCLPGEELEGTLRG
jgi:hypothetical protein